MKLSIIIAVYNMAREAPRTVLSACLPYQKDVNPDEYEVIVLDNGSDVPFQLDPDLTATLRPTPKIIRIDAARPSPVFALNWAARELAAAPNLMFCIDGARIFSDRLVSNMLRGLALFPDAFVYALACHIGPKMQLESTKEGYNQAIEDQLIREAGWPGDPTGLYRVSVFAASSRAGFFRPISESNSFSLPRDLLNRHGGFDERFTSPGAGLANLEIFSRYVTRPDAKNVCLLSDVTFHQVHGGIATSGIVQSQAFRSEYASIFGRDFAAKGYEAVYLGQIRPEAKALLSQSVAAA